MPQFQVILTIDISIDLDADDAADAEIVAYDAARSAMRFDGARVPSIRTIEVIEDGK